MRGADSPQKVNQYLDLYRRGLTLQQIALQMEVTKQAVSKALRCNREYVALKERRKARNKDRRKAKDRTRKRAERSTYPRFVRRILEQQPELVRLLYRAGRKMLDLAETEEQKTVMWKKIACATYLAPADLPHPNPNLARCPDRITPLYAKATAAFSLRLERTALVGVPGVSIVAAADDLARGDETSAQKHVRDALAAAGYVGLYTPAKKVLAGASRITPVAAERESAATLITEAAEWAPVKEKEKKRAEGVPLAHGFRNHRSFGQQSRISKAQAFSGAQGY